MDLAGEIWFLHALTVKKNFFFNFLQKKKKKKKNPNISWSYQTKGKFFPILPFFSCLLSKPLFSVWGIDVSFITAELYCFNCLSKINNTEKKMLVQKFSIKSYKSKHLLSALNKLNLVLSSWSTVGFQFSCMSACVCAQSCLTLCDLMVCSLPVSSIHGIYETRILEWIAISYSRGSSQHRDHALFSSISCIRRPILYHWAHLGSLSSLNIL